MYLSVEADTVWSILYSIAAMSTNVCVQMLTAMFVHSLVVPRIMGIPTSLTIVASHAYPTSAILEISLFKSRIHIYVLAVHTSVLTSTLYSWRVLIVY